MVTLGQGTTAQVTASVSSLGSNILLVRPGQAGFGPAQRHRGPEVVHRTGRRRHPDAGRRRHHPAAPIASRSLTAIFGNLNHAMPVTGTDNRYLDAREWNIASGRSFSDAEVQGGSAVCILGNTVKQALFADSDPVGAIIRLKQISCNVNRPARDQGQLRLRRRSRRRDPDADQGGPAPHCRKPGRETRSTSRWTRATTWRACRPTSRTCCASAGRSASTTRTISPSRTWPRSPTS
ncbi:MAG: ABC transporter permease [Bauldia sp.]